MFTYLGSPYSHPEYFVRLERFHAVCKVANRLMHMGIAVFCPIAHSHPIEMEDLKHIEGHDFWMRQDIPILRHASSMTVLMLDGWDKSKGLAQEIDTANKLYIPITYIREDYGITDTISAIHPPESLRTFERFGKATRDLARDGNTVL